MVLACFVGLMSCLMNGLEVLAVVVLEIVDFEGLILDIVAFEGTILTEFVLGLDGVALDDVTLGLADVFLVVEACGFFGNTPCSNKAGSGFVLVALELLVAVIGGFFLLSVLVIVFLGMLC